jgi:hypothetical protein
LSAQWINKIDYNLLNTGISKAKLYQTMKDFVVYVSDIIPTFSNEQNIQLSSSNYRCKS